MTEIRLVRPEEMQDAARLADAIFRDAEQPSMGAAFPDVFSPSLGQSYGAYEDGKMVAFMGLVPSIIHVGGAAVHSFQIGAVCTDPDYRGKGYASELLEAVFAHIDKSDGSLLLVSGDRSLYRRMNCLHFGGVTRFTLDAAGAAALKGSHLWNELRFREFEPTDWLAFKQLADARIAHFDQSVADLAKLVRHEALVSCYKLEHRVLVAERGGKPVAVSVFAVPKQTIKGTGAPFVLEWAGDATAAALLAAYAVELLSLPSLQVPVLRHEHELLRALALLGEGSQERNSGTVKIMNAQRLFDQLLPYWAAEHVGLPERLRAENLEDGTTAITLGGQSVTVDPQGLVSLVFDGAVPAGTDAALQEAFSRLFPIPFPQASGLNFV